MEKQAPEDKNTKNMVVDLPATTVVKDPPLVLGVKRSHPSGRKMQMRRLKKDRKKEDPQQHEEKTPFSSSSSEEILSGDEESEKETPTADHSGLDVSLVARTP